MTNEVRQETNAKSPKDQRRRQRIADAGKRMRDSLRETPVLRRSPTRHRTRRRGEGRPLAETQCQAQCE